jgi:antitoxin component HigA of HigAB toxin-antitoxin module
LDQYELPALDLLKLDVEGHEYEALQGAVHSIKKFKPVVIIEEKLDVEKRASAFLEKLGMRCVWHKKHDYLFTW